MSQRQLMDKPIEHINGNRVLRISLGDLFKEIPQGRTAA